MLYLQRHRNVKSTLGAHQHSTKKQRPATIFFRTYIFYNTKEQSCLISFKQPHNHITMATSLRHTLLLARTVRPFTRAYTTTLPLRAAPRVNPLIGNNTSRPAPATESKPPQAKPVPETPPPPPPPAEQAATETAPAEETSTPASKDHAYDALSFDIASIIGKKSAAYAESLGRNDPMSRPKVRTKAVLGRTIFIKPNVTATSAPTASVAFKLLDRLTRDQKIRTKYHSQRFHERPGLKRKRLKSQRWRARFKTGFKAAVSRVLELKKQGW